MGCLAPHGLICQAGAVVVGWSLSRRAFPIALPILDTGKITAAVVSMAFLLKPVTFAVSWGGLFQAITSGALVFAASAALPKIGGIRVAAFKYRPAVQNVPTW